MLSPHQLLQSLEKEPLFSDWRKRHQQSFLSHFFCPISAKGELKSDWEIGYYDSKSGKITIFIELPGKGFEIKPEDDVFKQETDQVEMLEMKNVKVSFADALKMFLEKAPTEFPKEQLGDGFIIIQTLKRKPLWNFTFVTRALKFVNLKINAQTAEIEDQQVVELVDKGK